MASLHAVLALVLLVLLLVLVLVLALALVLVLLVLLLVLLLALVLLVLLLVLALVLMPVLTRAPPPGFRQLRDDLPKLLRCGAQCRLLRTARSARNLRRGPALRHRRRHGYGGVSAPPPPPHTHTPPVACRSAITCVPAAFEVPLRVVHPARP